MSSVNQSTPLSTSFAGSATTSVETPLPIAPTLERSTRDALHTLDIFDKGEHYDNTTSYAFELYAHDDSIDDTVAFASYMAAYSDDTFQHI